MGTGLKFISGLLLTYLGAYLVSIIFYWLAKAATSLAEWISGDGWHIGATIIGAWVATIVVVTMEVRQPGWVVRQHDNIRRR